MHKFNFQSKFRTLFVHNNNMKHHIHIKTNDIKKNARLNIKQHQYWYYKMSLVRLSIVFLYLLIVLPALLSNSSSVQSQITIIISSILYAFSSIYIKFCVVSQLTSTIPPYQDKRKLLQAIAVGLLYILLLLSGFILGVILIYIGLTFEKTAPIVANLITIIGLMVMIILPTIISFIYSLAMIITAENKTIYYTTFEAAKVYLKQSKHLMKSNYTNLLKLRLSFVIWNILTWFILLGLPSIYFYQYKIATLVEFKRRINNENI